MELKSKKKQKREEKENHQKPEAAKPWTEDLRLGTPRPWKRELSWGPGCITDLPPSTSRKQAARGSAGPRGRNNDNKHNNDNTYQSVCCELGATLTTPHIILTNPRISPMK